MSLSLPLSEVEFERQFATASRRGAARRRNQPLAASARYDAKRGLIIELNNDCVVCVPLRLLPELAGASLKDLQQVEILGVGQALAWPALDQQFDLLQLLADVLGAKRLLANADAGRAKSKGKVPAARANGLKAGRPGKRRKAS